MCLKSLPSRSWFVALLLLSLLLLVAGLSGCHREPRGPVVRIGFMNCNARAETLARFRPLTAYLTKKVGVRFQAVAVNTQDFESRLKKGDFAFTHTNSLLYIIMHKNEGVQLVANDVRGQYGPRSAGTIIARKGSGITKLADIKGKRLVFGPMFAPTGYLAEYDLMLRHGINPEKDLAYYAIPSGSYKHEKVIYGVLFGKYDVGAAPALDLEVMTKEGKINPDDFVILAQSPLVPYCTFGAAKNVDPKLVAKVRQALLELKPSTTVQIDGERLKVLKAAWLQGYTVLKDSDYDVLRKMAKRANMPPYQKF